MERRFKTLAWLDLHQHMHLLHLHVTYLEGETTLDCILATKSPFFFSLSDFGPVPEKYPRNDTPSSYHNPGS